MNKAIRFFLYLLLAIFATTPIPGAPNSRPAQDRDAQASALFAEWDTSRTPGCSVGVIQDGEFIFKESFGMADLEHGIPLASDSMFYACSVSKQFVAMCVLLLEEEGRIALDDDVREYLPDFPDYGTPITIRHLVHHTSGIKDYFGLWEMAGNDFQDYMPDQAVYELIKRQKSLNFEPGEEHLYSNSCYFLLYRIIEKVSGMTLREYADKQIFTPLGMNNSFFHDDFRRLILNRAMGYYPGEAHGYLNQISRFDLVGSGGMFTCIADFLPWDNNFYDNRLGQGDQGLIRKMTASGRLNNGKDIEYAFALVPGTYRGLEIVEHSGSLGGYRTHYLRFPEERFSVVILSNLSSFDPGSKARELAEIYLGDGMRASDGNNSTPPTETSTQDTEKELANFTIDPQKQDEYSGSWYSGELDTTYHIKAHDDHLVLKVRYRPAMRLNPAAPGYFKGAALQIKFEEHSPGKTDSFSAGTEGVRDIIFTKVP